MYQSLYEKYKKLQSDYSDAEQNNLMLSSQVSSYQQQVEYLSREKVQSREIQVKREEIMEEMDNFKQESEKYKDMVVKYKSSFSDYKAEMQLTKSNLKHKEDEYNEALQEIDALKNERTILKSELENRKKEIVHLKEDIGGISEIMEPTIIKTSARRAKGTNHNVKVENIISEASIEEEEIPSRMMASDFSHFSNDKVEHSLFTEIEQSEKKNFEKSMTMPLKKDERMSAARRDNVYNELMVLKKMDFVDDNMIDTFNTNRKIIENREDFTFHNKVFQPQGHYDLDDCSKTSDSNSGNVRKTPKRHCLNSIDRDIYEDFFILTAQCVKLNSPRMEDILDIDVKPYYKEVLQKLIPFHKWYSWLEQRLKSVIFVSKTSIRDPPVSAKDFQDNHDVKENEEKTKKKRRRIPFM